MTSPHLQLATTESFIKTSLTKTVVTLPQSNFPAEEISKTKENISYPTATYIIWCQKN